MSVAKEKKVKDEKNNDCYIQHSKTEDDFEKRKIVNLSEISSFKPTSNSY